MDNVQLEALRKKQDPDLSRMVSPEEVSHMDMVQRDDKPLSEESGMFSEIGKGLLGFAASQMPGSTKDSSKLLGQIGEETGDMASPDLTWATPMAAALQRRGGKIFSGNVPGVEFVKSPTSYNTELVAKVDGKDIGHIRVNNKQRVPGYLPIEGASINPEFRGKGLYPELLEYGVDEAKEKGLKGISSNARSDLAEKSWGNIDNKKVQELPNETRYFLEDKPTRKKKP